jgi:polyphosphate kinase
MNIDNEHKASNRKTSPALAVGAADAPAAEARADGKTKQGKARSDTAVVVAAPAEAVPRKPMSAKDYDKALKSLHVELVRLQEWVKHKGLKVCILFEGRDGAGKGGTIKAITERVSPRVFRVVALPAPTDREKSQMYIQRYIGHLPAAGEVVIFDRSWYNRAGVERVMGFTPERDVEKFLKAAPLVEKAFVESGIILLKYWLEVSPEEQTRRIAGRINDGRKIWKLSPMDVLSYSRWFDYSRARDAMFEATDSSWAPWYAVRSDDKRSTRLNIISHILEQIPYKEVPREKVVLPKRQKRGDYEETKYPFRYIAAKY